MKSIKRTNRKVVFQGDIAIIRVTELPKKAEQVKTDIVAHSETGHHHVATNANIFAIPGDDMSLYMRATKKTLDVVHQRPFDTHETLRFFTEPGDMFKIQRQREWTPEGWRRVED